MTPETFISRKENCPCVEHVFVVPVTPILLSELDTILRLGNFSNTPLVQMLLVEEQDEHGKPSVVFLSGPPKNTDENPFDTAIRIMGKETSMISMSTQLWKERLIHEAHGGPIQVLAIPVREHQFFGMHGLKKGDHATKRTLVRKDVEHLPIEGLRDDLSHQVQEIEDEIRRGILSSINRLRLYSWKEQAKSLLHCSNHEIRIGYISSQMHFSLMDERIRETQGGFSPPPSADFYKLLPFIVTVPADHLGELLMATPTREVLHVVNQFKRALKHTMNTYDGMLPWQTAFQNLLMEVNALPLYDRMKKWKTINEVFCRECEKAFQIDALALHDAYNAAQNMGEYFNDQMHYGEPTFQQYNRSNEVTNASLLTLATYMMGYHPNKAFDPSEASKTNQLMRFEAGSVLTDFSIATKVPRQDNDFIQGVIDTVFPDEPVMQVEVLPGEIPHTVLERSIYVPYYGTVRLLIDERPEKKTERNVIKMLQNTSGDIRDKYSINFVVGDDTPYLREYGNTIDNHISLMNAVEKRLYDEIQANLPEMWQMNVRDGSMFRAYENIIYPLHAVPNEAIVAKARPGSIGERIVRRHTVVEITDAEGQKQYCEFNFYPFERLSGPTVPKRIEEYGLLGFFEKVADNANGQYAYHRLKVRKHPTEASIVGLKYPWELYHR